LNYPLNVHQFLSLHFDITNFRFFTINTEYFSEEKADQYQIGYIKDAKLLEKISMTMWFVPGVVAIFILMLILKKLGECFKLVGKIYLWLRRQIVHSLWIRLII
jgi:hypothetical protein